MRTRVVLGTLVLGMGLLQADSAFPADTHSYTAGYFLLDLDGVSAWLRRVDGGDVRAEVAEIPDPHQPRLSKKHLGRVGYEDVHVQIDPGTVGPMTDWIASLLAGKPIRKGGAVVLADADQRERGRVEFEDALLTEVTIPACDVSSPRDPASLTLTLAPEVTRWTDGSGVRTPAPKKDEPKRWLPSNFRLAIDGLDCRRVQKIEAFTIRQRTMEDELGENRPYTKEPGRLEIPNLKLWIDAVDVNPWRDWHRSFVVDGKNGDGSELGGSLVFLAPDLATEVFHLDLHHVGIYRLTELPEEVDDPQRETRCFVVELYVESMELRPLAK